MAADRILKAASPEAVAERKRAIDLTTLLCDSVVQTRQDVGEQMIDAAYLLGRFAWELAVLAAVLREGADASELERRLAERPNVVN